MRDAVLLGGGGHAMSCLDAADSGDLNFVGYVGPQPDEKLDLPYLGGDEALPELRRSVELAFVALGDNRRREALTSIALDHGFRLASVVATTARISPTATVGPGSVIMHGALIGPRSRVGAGVIVNTAASIDHDCTLEDFVHIAPGTHLAGGVHIEAGTFAGVGVSVIPDVRIGAWAVIGAGSTVINHIEPELTVVGAPARTRRRS
jgi:sugar O-acyltransferase (sialic acid O-acetyltransferase NeuD family)